MTIERPMPPTAFRPRRRRLKSLAFLPSLLTVGNLLCGFAAIHFALRAMHEFGAGIQDEHFRTLNSVQLERILPSWLSVACGLVLIGMLFDCFDGLIARVTCSITQFGAQLDSLADVITCGAAPAVLLVTFMTQQLAGESILPSPVSEHFLGRATWISAAVYLAFSAIRLARFNVENARSDHDYRTFRGLPSPGAAALIVTFILFHEHVVQTSPLAAGVAVYAMPAVAIATAFLMVSRIPYRRFHRAYLVGRKPFGHLVVFLAVFAVFWSYKAPTLLVLVAWYWASGPVEWTFRKLRGRRAASLVPESSPVAEASTDWRIAGGE